MINETRSTLRLPNELKEKLKKEAKAQHRSLHNLIISILWQYITNK